MMLESRYTCPVMIGRQREMDALGRIRAHVEAGEGRTVLIAGEAGVGKSRLLAGLVEQARKEEWSVLVGHCYPQDINLPYGPLLDALRTYLHPLSPDYMASLLGPYAPEFIKLLPELSRLFPDIQPEAPVEPQAENAGCSKRSTGSSPTLPAAAQCSFPLRIFTGPTIPASNCSICSPGASLTIPYCWLPPTGWTSRWPTREASCCGTLLTWTRAAGH